MRFMCILLISIGSSLRFAESSPSSSVINNNIHSVNSLGHTFKETTLDKVKLIRHVPSGKCLIIENADALERTGYRVVLWECHDIKHITGLEQEMFSLVKGVDNGYILMGNAGSLDHCPFAGREYYDTLEVNKCDPLNAYQSWTFRRIEGTIDSYQIVHLVSGRCLRVPSAHDGAWVRSGDCDLADPNQSWRVCGLDHDCSFTI